MWDWQMILSALTLTPTSQTSVLLTENKKKFLANLCNYFKPSNGNNFAKLELNSPKSVEISKSGLAFLDYLCQDDQCQSYLDDFLMDLKNHLSILTSSNSWHDCLLSPTKVASTNCQHYFLFLGRLTRSSNGRKALERHNFKQICLDLISFRTDMYLKLILSSLDYSFEMSRGLLSVACRDANSENAKIFAFNVIGLILRAKTPNVAQWGIQVIRHN